MNPLGQTNSTGAADNGAQAGVHASPPAVHSRADDYGEVIKPRISLMVALSAAAGFYLAPDAGKSWLGCGLAALGVTLVSWSASALNQVLERDTDGMMRRTRGRPLPTGRLSVFEVTAVGLACGITGLALLAFGANLLTCGLALLALVLYVLAYTPLKRLTCISLVIGAVPGAAPPVLGWTAAGGPLGWAAAALFGLLFVWQFPHFLAIAWIHREDYSRAGLRMLPPRDEEGRLAGLLAVVYALVLIPLCLQPVLMGLAGGAYAAVAVAVALGYAAAAAAFARTRSTASARRLLWASLICLPGVYLALVCDHWRLSAFAP